MTNPIINFSLDQDVNDTSVMIPKRCLHHYTDEFNKEELLQHTVTLNDGLVIIPLILFNNNTFTNMERFSLLVKNPGTGRECLDEEYRYVTNKLRNDKQQYLPYWCYATDFKLEI